MGISTEALISIVGVFVAVPSAVVILLRLSKLFRSPSPDADAREYDDIEIGLQRPPLVHFRPQLKPAVTWPQQRNHQSDRVSSNPLPIRQAMYKHHIVGQRPDRTRPGMSVSRLV
ncbi:hypothetical protein FSARC_5899 [Fusarium sarcochroum]|uniref:Uncharacterized protein n=1 Tax=Fusarium sarcochroum TaxID=1208366 RepID=A0A8H4TYD4_9HYPO|nr:hypothetical protein FSARC_5899 [Fusarium sarcochroum]